MRKVSRLVKFSLLKAAIYIRPIIHGIYFDNLPGIWETKFVFNVIVTLEVYSQIEGTDIDETILQARVIVQIMGKDKVLY